jgi:Ca-activated chloride channel family protein
MTGLGKFSFVQRFMLPALIFLFLIGAVKGSPAQIDDVHIAPPTSPIPSAMASSSLVASLDGSRPLKAESDLVLVPVTVTDEMNPVIKGLGPANFQVFEGHKSQQIRHFSSEDSPVSLGIILDTSGSMKSKMLRAREAVAEFCRTANLEDEFFVITFADEPGELMDFTASADDIDSKLLYTLPKGRTSLLDAVYMGITKMRQARYPRRALLVISDGGDNHSRYTESEIRSVVREADVTIYSLGLYDRSFPTREEELGPELLSDLAQMTGGHAFTLDNVNDLPIAAKIIGVELRSQYVLAYRSSVNKKDGKWRKIHVKLCAIKGFPQLHIHAKAGYYAPSN